MSACEARGLPYVFRLRLTNNVKRAIERMAGSSGWQNAGQGWQGIKERLQLSGWSQARRVVLLRRRIREGLAHSEEDDRGQLRLSFAEIDDGEVYEHAALVTSLDAEILTLGQLYRDRADCENTFDELRHQWDGAGSRRTISPAANLPLDLSLLSTTGGTYLCGSPTRPDISRRSPAVHCC